MRHQDLVAMGRWQMMGSGDQEQEISLAIHSLTIKVAKVAYIIFIIYHI